MREIKFRAWDDEQKEWIRDFAVYETGSGVHWSEEHGQTTFEFGSRFKVCQNTGLKDKNGKEIYEGDIVTVPNYAFQPDNGLDPVRIVEVVFDCGSFSTEEGLLADEDDKEIIGNIYETPELLK